MTLSIHYYRTDPPNFGDALNGILWERLIPGLSGIRSDAVLVGIGTILDEHIPAGRPVLVFGSGAGLIRLPPLDTRRDIRILAVRGPLTARIAGLPPELAITDPALLVRHVFPELVRTPFHPAAGPVVFVPHVTTADQEAWTTICQRAGVELVDPRSDCLQVMRRIAGARLVITEAMHAAIVADAFRVPWVPLASTPQFSTFKWADWTLSMRVPLRPERMAPISIRHAVQQYWLGHIDRCRVDVEIGSDDLEAPAVRMLLQATRTRMVRHQGAAGRALRLKLAALHNRMLDPLARWAGQTSLRAVNRRLEDAAVKRMRELAQRGGCLSDEALSKARLHSLLACLQELRGLLGEVTSPPRDISPVPGTQPVEAARRRA